MVSNIEPTTSRDEIMSKYDKNGDGAFKTNPDIANLVDDYRMSLHQNSMFEDIFKTQKKFLTMSFVVIAVLCATNIGTAVLAAKNFNNAAGVTDSAGDIKAAAQLKTIGCVGRPFFPDGTPVGSAPPRKPSRRLDAGEDDEENIFIACHLTDEQNSDIYEQYDTHGLAHIVITDQDDPTQQVSVFLNGNAVITLDANSGEKERVDFITYGDDLEEDVSVDTAGNDRELQRYERTSRRSSTSGTCTLCDDEELGDGGNRKLGEEDGSEWKLYFTKP